MHPEQVKVHVGNLPYMQLRHANTFYDLITTHNLRSVLELGFFHGVSTAYIAGAVEDAGGGSVTTIDLETAHLRAPNIEQLLTACGLRHLVNIIYEPRTFNWRLMRFIEQDPTPSFDLIYIDGAHTWVDSGFAFCLCRTLLRPGGWIVFDDIRHTFRTSNSRDKSWVLRMSEEEQTTPQIERVFSLLTLRDPSFDTFRIRPPFAFARKRLLSAPATPESHLIEQQVARAADLAHIDPVFRDHLLHNPAHTLAGINNDDVTRFRHVRFVESYLRSPSEPDLAESGILTHVLDLPAARRPAPGSNHPSPVSSVPSLRIL
jgi:predicted O-methyltransferase YrrM